MEILQQSDDISVHSRQSVLAIGNFDGVHRGHQAVLKTAKDCAVRLKARSGVMIFEPHPREFFQPDTPFFRLTSVERKLELFSKLGLDQAVILNFDQFLSGLSAEQFVKEILIDWLDVAHVVTGYDFYFGKGRGGSPDLMQQFGQEYGFGVTIVEPVGETVQAFSSRHIREHLRNGRVREAGEELGYWWQVQGKVVSGSGRGMGLGYPTANIALDCHIELQFGIYAVRLLVDGKLIDGAGYFGKRPTFDNGESIFEVFLFDFDSNLYGKKVAVEIIEFLRGDEKYSSEEVLIAQMDLDCKKAKSVLQTIGKSDPNPNSRSGVTEHI